MLLSPLVLTLASIPVGSSAADASALLFPCLATDPVAEPAVRAPMLADSGGWSFSYTYIEVGAIQFDVHDIDDDVDIYYGRASLGLFDFLYLFGEYQNQSTDFEDTDTDLIGLGAGVHVAVHEHVDLLGEVTFLYSDISSDLDELDDTTNGYEVFAGARWMAMPWEHGGLELNGGFGYVDLDNRLASDDEAWGWEAGARVHFLDFLSVGSTYSKLEDDDQFAVNVRFSF